MGNVSICFKRGFRSAKKLQFVYESLNLKNKDLGEYVRSNGLYSSELIEWKDKMIKALDDERPLVNEERNRYELKIKLLEKEVHDLNLKLEI